MSFPDEAFDVIYCSHVLDDVPDDMRALRELNRVLRSDGWALILIPPVISETTIEGETITDPEERRLVLGDEGDARRYGRDFVNRLRDANFKVQVTEVLDLCSRETAIRMGLTSASGEIYHCTKL